MNQLNEDQLELYLSTFDEEPDNLERYAEYLSIITFNQVSPNNFLIKKKLNSLIEYISNYWENKNNCNYTLNNRFVERRFNNFSFIGKIQNINNSITNKIYEKVINDQDLNYLNDIVRDNRFIDSEIKKYYNINNHTKMTNEDINQIYNQIPNEYFKYVFIDHSDIIKI